MSDPAIIEAAARALLAEAVKALEPFAEICAKYPGHAGWRPEYEPMHGLTLAQFRQAATVLTRLRAAAEGGCP